MDAATWGGPAGGPGFGTAPDYIALSLLALLIDAVFGGAGGLRRAVPGLRAAFQWAALALDRKLNRARRSERDRQIRGALVAFFMVFMGAALGAALHAGALRIPQGWIVETLVLAALISPRRAFDHMRRVARLLADPKPDEKTRAEISRALLIFGPLRADQADDHALARRAIEGGGSALYERFVGPAFWYAVLGLAGAVGYVAINETARVIGGTEKRRRQFGSSVRGLDDAASYIPARILVLLMMAGSVFAPKARPVAMIRAVARQSRHHVSVAAGPVAAAIAGAFDLALQGPETRDGVRIERPWVGDGRARAMPVDILKTVYLYGATAMIASGLIAGGWVLRLWA